MPAVRGAGAGGDAPDVKRLHASYEYGVIAMDAYAFS